MVFDMFRTTKRSSSGIFVYAVLWYVFMRPHKQSVRWQDVWYWHRAVCLYELMQTYYKTSCRNLPEDERLRLVVSNVSKSLELD